MVTKWWYRRQGREAGPVSQEELRRLIGRGAIGPEDLIRAEEQAEWIEVESSPLFSGASSDAAARILARAHITRLTGTGTERNHGRAQRASTSAAIASIAAVCGNCVQRLVSVLTFIPPKALRVGGGIAACVILAAAAWSMLPEPSPSAEALVVYEVQIADVGQLRRDNGDESAWRRLQSDIDATSSRLVPHLTRAAEGGDAAALELLRVGRDHLPRIAANRSSTPGESDAAAEFHLDRARRFLPLKDEGGRLPGWLIPAVVIADGIIIVGAVIWVVRRR